VRSKLKTCFWYHFGLLQSKTHTSLFQNCFQSHLWKTVISSTVNDPIQMGKGRKVNNCRCASALQSRPNDRLRLWILIISAMRMTCAYLLCIQLSWTSRTLVSHRYPWVSTRIFFGREQKYGECLKWWGALAEKHRHWTFFLDCVCTRCKMKAFSRYH